MNQMTRLVCRASHGEMMVEHGPVVQQTWEAPISVSLSAVCQIQSREEKAGNLEFNSVRKEETEVNASME